MKHKFIAGFVLGTFATVATAAISVFTFKKTYIDPVENKVDEINENRRKAIRKSLGAHQA
ncbi:DUF3042 family protein [Lacticaseibacillus sharpeae]|uniref:DUF3042 domain-containing protein n=1 Tax=Lacticaseibacillus sharpeae JCM 1186 = DSM 20505 TaxID=1291052 RepID=A0A0R1ZWY6_9LACO|nr:DUF3042 family protein [Lacticaseibacillus sharpeae]KRM56377.1 hypothetical protein FC18_GL000060 [Lacticaseibacillus sharpeae JCM 1186 = DSM 20505]